MEAWGFPGQTDEGCWAGTNKSGVTGKTICHKMESKGGPILSERYQWRKRAEYKAKAKKCRVLPGRG